MIDVFEIGASLNVHGNGLDFMQAFSSSLAGAHGQLDALEKKLGATKGAMKDLFLGAGEVFAGVEMLKGLKDLAEAGKELNHQQSMLMRNGVDHRDVMRETSAIYKDMLSAVPTASAVDFLRTLGELKSVKGSVAGAREALEQSLKIEALIGNSTGKSAEGQGYDFWRAVEDKGIIQNKEKTDAMLDRMVQGTIATGGKVGGNDWFTYARRAGSAWIGDSIDALPLQLMEMQTLSASGAGVARRAFANRIEGGVKLTKAQKAGWAEIGMLGADGNVTDSALEQSRPDLFIGKVIDALAAHGINNEAKVKAWSAHALHGKDADYFMTAYAGMTETDPETGLTRLQKERRNMGEAQPLDKAYKTMMGTDYDANIEALEKQWESFREAIGGPATKAAIPVLQDLTGALTKMAAFADKHQDWTQFGVDAAAVAGGLLAIGGSLTIARGALRLAGGGLLGLGRKGLGLDASASTMATAGETQMSAAKMMMEAATEMRGKGGVPGALGGGGDPLAPGRSSPGYASLLPGALGFAIQAFELAKNAPDELKRAAADNALVDPSVAREAGWGDVARHFFGVGAGVPFHPLDDDRRTRARSRGLSYDAPNHDGNALHRHDDELSPVTALELRRTADAAGMAGDKFGDLGQKTGLVLTSFDGLSKNTLALTGSADSLSNDFRILEATAIGAARALASIAMGGGGGFGGGGGGFTKASWGGDGSPIVGSGGTVDASLPPEARAFLDTISSGEARGYNVLNGGGTFADLSHHPGGRAAGRYQDLPSTWRRISGALGLHDFSPMSQDKGNWWLAQQDYHAHTGRDLLGDLQSHDPGRIAAVGRALHSTWVSTNGSFARKFEHFMGGQHHAPAPPPSHAPAADHATTAAVHVLHAKLDRLASAIQNIKVQAHLHVDGRKMAEVVTHHQIEASRWSTHPNYHDDSAHYAPPDAAG